MNEAITNVLHCNLKQVLAQHGGSTVVLLQEYQGGLRRNVYKYCLYSFWWFYVNAIKQK